jgi:hypothetical protein
LELRLMTALLSHSRNRRLQAAARPAQARLRVL